MTSNLAGPLKDTIAQAETTRRMCIENAASVAETASITVLVDLNNATDLADELVSALAGVHESLRA